MERRTGTRSPQEVMALCRERDVRAVDLRFCDLLGRQHHITVPSSRLTESAFEDGIGFDGSSIRLWQAVEESDLLLIPQPTNAWIDPFSELPTAVLTCAVQDPITRQSYAKDPRQIAIRAENYLRNSGAAETAQFGPEAEFYVFDSVQFDQRANTSFYQVESNEGWWTRGIPGPENVGHKIRRGEGYMPNRPSDQTASLRNEMMQTLIECGIEVECHHHEVGSAGQAEIDFHHSTLVSCADSLMAYKYIVKNVANRHGKSLTFMPKPLMDENGSGMHVHLSLWKGNDTCFAGKGYAGLSDDAIHAIGGILKHGPALLALTNPTTNSYKRLVPGFEAPTEFTYSQRNRSAACRVPMTNPAPMSKRIELRFPDASCNPYLAFAAILLAAIDGIQNKLDPGPALDTDVDRLQNATAARRMPANLDEALFALEDDYDFLLRGDVFSEEILREWVLFKREQEVAPMNVRPHPYEFCLYYDS